MMGLGFVRKLVAGKRMNLTRSPVAWQSIPRCRWLSALRIAPTVILMALAAMTLPAWGQLVTHNQAARLGLERAWFAQVNLDQARHRIANWLLHDNFLFAVTTGGTIHVLDATTGKTVWATQVGQPKYPTLGPAASQKDVAVINGSKLILLDRANGRIKWTRKAGDAPSSSPALSETHVFVALINGRVEAFPIEDTKQPIWYYQSSGRAYYKPVATAKSISWATDLGYLYVGRLNPLNLLFRLETGGEIVASPTGMDPYLLVGSTDGNLYCVHEQSGVEHWRYITGYPITKTPAVVGEQVFITSQEPRLHVLDATTGRRQWTIAGVAQFVALGKQHVYATDRDGSLLVLDAKTGGLVGRLPHHRKQSWSAQSPWSERGPALVNDQNDRIFLVSNTGLVQCLHEIGVSDPILYRQPAGDSENKAGSTAAKSKDRSETSLEQGESPSTESDQVNDQPAATKTPDADDSDTETTTEPAMDDPFSDPDNPFGG
jgi:outer membrane protein assembly factor BamB